jgi:CheY-like chemotaxis protein/two-component sensor histidine kinase
MIGKSSDNLERKDYSLRKIDDASQHLLGVINDILDMSKIEANKFELSPAEFGFEKMLQRIVNVLTFRLDEKNQKLMIHIDSAIPHTLVGDDQRLAQVITNLLSNAIKFTPEQGAINLDACLSGEEDGLCTILFTVKDTGIGISAEQQKRLFQSFHQADSETTRKYGGSGLGLSISKNIVEMMNGRIWVESEIGEGSVFSFTAKLKRSEGKKTAPVRRHTNWKNIRIMVVDDDPDVLLYFREIMQEFKLHCDTASSGSEAVSLVKQNGPYNIYFVDWLMPEMDGMTLSKELHSTVPGNAVVIMISAHEWRSIEKDARMAGVDMFLSKPLFPSAIVDAINEALGVDSQEVKELQPDIAGIFAGRRILLVEDVDINREIVITLLEPTNIKIDCARNGMEAVSMFAQGRYDLVFMDLQMPEMDGFEAVRLIRALELPYAKEIPIVAMTANVFREDVEKCLEAGMNDHVGKTLDFNEILEKLKRYMR